MTFQIMKTLLELDRSCTVYSGKEFFYICPFLIDFAEGISRQLNIQAVVWLLLAAFCQIYGMLIVRSTFETFEKFSVQLGKKHFVKLRSKKL